MIRVLSILLLTWTGPTVREVTPEGGGRVVRWSMAYDFACGYQETVPFAPYPAVIDQVLRSWVWTEETGTLWLDQIVDLPPNEYIENMVECADDYLLFVSVVSKPGELGGRTLLVKLSKDTNDWYGKLPNPYDLDGDGDVDMTDFGLRQRLGGDMADWRERLTGAK